MKMTEILPHTQRLGKQHKVVGETKQLQHMELQEGQLSPCVLFIVEPPAQFKG